MDIRETSVAKSLIDEIESEQFIDRRTEEYKAYKVAEGGQRSYVEQRLQTLFPKSWDTMRVSDVSISNKVISKQSKAYKESPIRKLGNQTEKMDEIFTEGNFDSVMGEFDRDFNRQRYGLLWVNKILEDITFHSLKGFESFVKVNKKTGKTEVVVLNYPDTEITSNGNNDTDYLEQNLAESQDDTSAESRIYAMWTKEHHSVWKISEKKDHVSKQITKSIENVPIEGNEAMKNDLGIIPFVYRSKSSSVDLPFLNQLTEQSITYNILNSDLLTASALQGYGQLVVSLPEDMEMETMHSGMTTAINLPIVAGAEAQADAKYINPGPDLAGMRDTVNNYGGDILSEHGIQSQGVKDGDNFSSGFERLIASADVSDQINANQMVYAKMEKEVVDILQAYGDLRESSEELVTIFPKPKIMISDKETLENIKMRLDMGLITKTEALQIIDPNLDDAAAQEKIDGIKKESEASMPSFLGGDNGNTSTENPEPRPFENTEK